MRFILDDTINASHKIGEVSGVSIDSLSEKLGEPNIESDDGKSDALWNGAFIASDESKHRASVWDWKGGLIHNGVASVWIANLKYLPEFIRYLES